MNPKKFSSRKSMPLKGYDYSKPGVYYVTICSKNLEFLFGEIIRGVMYPSEGGFKVIECWKAIPDHYPEVRLHEFILMPNHIHGLLEIVESEDLESSNMNSTAKIERFGWAQNVEPLPNPQFLESHQNKRKNNQRRNEFQHIIPKSLGSIVRGFEIGVTKWFRQNTNVHDVWHRNFYDSIIRSEKVYNRVAKYIRNNQKNWTRDKFNKK